MRRAFPDFYSSPAGPGRGRFNSEWALRTFTTEHWVSVAPGQVQFAF